MLRLWFLLQFLLLLLLDIIIITPGEEIAEGGVFCILREREREREREAMKAEPVLRKRLTHMCGRGVLSVI